MLLVNVHILCYFIQAYVVNIINSKVQKVKLWETLTVKLAGKHISFRSVCRHASLRLPSSHRTGPFVILCFQSPTDRCLQLHRWPSSLNPRSLRLARLSPQLITEAINDSLFCSRMFHRADHSLLCLMLSSTSLEGISLQAFSKIRSVLAPSYHDCSWVDNKPSEVWVLGAFALNFSEMLGQERRPNTTQPSCASFIKTLARSLGKAFLSRPMRLSTRKDS